MAEKIDLSEATRIFENIKEGSIKSKDYYKFIIGLSTGALFISVTFIDKLSVLPNYKPLTVIGWVCLIISIVSGVWLLPKHDFIEGQWRTLLGLILKPENILFGIEQDVSKTLARELSSGFLKEEMAKEHKDDEKIKTLRRSWLIPNGSKAKAFFKAIVSTFETIDPSLSKVLPDIAKEFGKWERWMNKHAKELYFPYILKRIRRTDRWVRIIQKVMAASFYIGIILITLSSATSFLNIDLIDIAKGLIKR